LEQQLRPGEKRNSGFGFEVCDRPIASRQIEIERAPETRSGLQVPDWSRRFIRGASRGCKVRFSEGVIINPAVDAEAGRPVEADTDQPRKSVSGQLGTNGIGDIERLKIWGDPEID
jgi:hypothetical protein